VAEDDAPQDEGIRERLSRQSEEALGKIAEELVGNPVVNAAISRAFEAREKAAQAQEAAMGALGIPSAADIERLTRRLRSVSQRLEGIEDSVDRLDERLAAIEGGVAGLDEEIGKVAKAVSKPVRGRKEADDGGERRPALEARLDEMARDLAALREAVAPGAEPPPRAQERLTVSES
jgi:predicted RNase H-like nuclease (RuvC/YqgF family)